MKIIDSNKWAPRHKLILSMPMGLAMFYYRLASLGVLPLDEDDYFDESD